VPANPGAHRQYELVAVANRSTRVPQSAVYRGVGVVATASCEWACLEVAHGRAPAHVAHRLLLDL